MKKSQATSALAWILTHAARRQSPRGLPGGPLGHGFADCVRGETLMTRSSRSTLAIRSLPHSGFSAAMRRMSYRCDGSPRFSGQRNQTDKFGQQPKDDSNENDHAAIMPQLGASRAAWSVHPRSNIRGAQPFHIGATFTYHCATSRPSCRSSLRLSPSTTRRLPATVHKNPADDAVPRIAQRRIVR